MLDRKRGYAFHRPFYAVDPNAFISAGMVAFLANSGGATLATVAASGTVPIGTFWKDHNLAYFRTTVETCTFNSSNIATVLHGNFYPMSAVKVTNVAGTVIYTNGVDYSVTVTNGVLTRIVGGLIPALGSVVVWYQYMVLSSAINYNGGSNYDRQPDDTLGSGKITVAEGDAKLYVDQFDPTATYTLNHPLYSDIQSRWTTISGYTSACGRVISVPTASDPFLGVQQVTVTS